MSSSRQEPPNTGSPEIVTSATKVVYQNRWMTVREDQIVRRDGTNGIYGVVEKTDFALVVPYENEGFHLVEQYRYPVRSRFCEFPQGSWEDRPGADPLEVARAELLEETGLIATDLTHLGYLYEAYGYSNQGLHVLLAINLTRGTAQPEHEEQGLTSRWYAEEEVWRLIEEGSMRDAPSVAALALFLRHRRANGPLLDQG